MRRFLCFALGVLVASGGLAWCGSMWADDDDRDRPDPPRQSLGNLSPDDPTSVPAIQGSPPPEGHRPPVVVLPPIWGPEPFPRRPWPPFVEDPYWPDHHHHHPWPPHYPPPYWRPYPYYYGPVVVPAEQLYGPLPVQRFMGVPPAGRLAERPAAPRAAPAPADPAAPPKAEKPPVQARTNERSVNLAWRLIGFGDAYFANQKYHDAQSRYKDAAETAPGVAEAYFRQGVAGLQEVRSAFIAQPTR